MSDENLQDSIEQVGRQVENLQRQLQEHVDSGHVNFVSSTYLEETLSEFKSQQDILADVVLGKPHRNYDGETERRGGMKAMIEAYENGGLKIHIPWGKLTAIMVAIITATGGIIVAIIESRPPTP